MSNQLQFSIVLIFTSVFGLAYLSWQVTQFANATVLVGKFNAAETTSSTEITVASSSEKSDSALFVGDVMLGRNVEFLSLIHGYSFPFLYTEDIFNHEVVVANFESAEGLPRHERSRAGTFRFSTHPALTRELGHQGVTHASLANNHAYDFGKAGYEQIKHTLANSGIISFGHPIEITDSSATYFEINEKTVAVIGLHTLFVPVDLQKLEGAIRTAAQRSDYQIAYIHWGTEYERTHSAEQEWLSKKMVEYGIDAIIGHHPHVTQDIQEINGVPVFYSLGNFIFDQYFQREVQEGYALALSFTDQAAVYEIIPISSLESRSQPRLMSEADQAIFLAEVTKLSGPQLAPGILGKQLSFPLAPQP